MQRRSVWCEDGVSQGTCVDSDERGDTHPRWEAVRSPKVAVVCGTGTLTNSHAETHTMLRAGKALRFTPNEIEEFRSLGLDFDGARTQDAIEQALAAWTETLADERPDLLNKIFAMPAATEGP